MTEQKTIQIKKESITLGVIALLAIALVISIVTGGFTGKATDENCVLEKPSPAAIAPSVKMNQLIDDDSIEGNPDAKVTIVEFSDYECPYCGRFYSDAYQQIKSEYIDTGKVKFVYRDFPLSFHKNAQKAAEAAECAGEQGKYYDMNNQLFENGVEGGVDSFKGYAKTIGLDQNQFDTCLDSGAMVKEIQKDFQDGQKAGVKGTPAFFIDGELISGAQPFSVFKQKIDSLL